MDMATALNLNAFRRQEPKAERAPLEDTKVEWTNLDVESLSDDLRDEYYAYRKAMDSANKLRMAFEASMEIANDAEHERLTGKSFPDHLRLAFGYKFGKISVAIVPAERKGARKTAMSLAEILKRAG
jgi:hypothetical protein